MSAPDAPEPDREELLSLLERLDDAEFVERPADFDLERMAARVAGLCQRLGVAFGCEVRLDTSVQDAAHFAYVDVPAACTSSGRDVSIRPSNFYPLAFASSGSTPFTTDSPTGDELAPDDRTRVDEALAAGGFTVVPVDVARRPYDGRCDWLRAESGVTWFRRFFDHL